MTGPIGFDPKISGTQPVVTGGHTAAPQQPTHTDTLGKARELFPKNWQSQAGEEAGFKSDLGRAIGDMATSPEIQNLVKDPELQKHLSEANTLTDKYKILQENPKIQEYLATLENEYSAKGTSAYPFESFGYHGSPAFSDVLFLAILVGAGVALITSKK